MLKKIVFFFQRSIRNKLTVALPLVIAFILAFLFTLSILSLRNQVMDHFIETAKNQFTVIENEIGDHEVHIDAHEDAVFKGILYAQIFGHQGNLWFQKSPLSDYAISNRHFLNTLDSYSKEGLTVKKMIIEGQKVIEMQKMVDGRRMLVGFSLAPVQELLFIQTLTLICIALLTVASVAVVVASIGHIVSEPICKLAIEAAQMATGESTAQTLSLSNRKDEVGLLATELNNLLTTINKQQEEITVHKVEAELGRVATQVAHDIRGPLSSMQAAVGYFGEMKVEDKKFSEVLNLLQLSAKRLTGVADGLLQKHKGVEETNITFSLYKVLDELVGEYNSQCPEVRFAKEYAFQAIELHGNPAKLQRAFGNIIKNAVEAMQFKGVVVLRTELQNNKVIVSISDTGPGMCSEKLEKVLKGGYTEGKKDGNGIGTQVLHQMVKEYRGEFSAKSQVGQGTTFFITLPLSEQTSTNQLVIQSHGAEPIIIIDDDPSLREQWRLNLQEKGKQILLCESFEDFETQKITSELTKTAIVDYHFDNSELNGGDVIRKLKGLGFANLYLCTAEYWKPSLQKLAEELNVTLCPKPLPKIHLSPLLCKEGLGEVESLPKSGYNVLVIDDDEAIRMAWEFSQQKLNIAELHCYSSMEAMRGNGIDLNSIHISFVDKNIEGSAFTGADVISFLKTHCAGKIVLASGENEKVLREDPQFAHADFFIQDKIPSSLSQFSI